MSQNVAEEIEINWVRIAQPSEQISDAKNRIVNQLLKICRKGFLRRPLQLTQSEIAQKLVDVGIYERIEDAEQGVELLIRGRGSLSPYISVKMAIGSQENPRYELHKSEEQYYEEF